MQVKVDLSGLYRKLNKVSGKISRLRRFLDNLLQRTAASMRAIAPVRTGALRASIQSHLFASAGNEIRGQLVASVRYASYQQHRFDWERKTSQLKPQITRYIRTLKG